MNVFGRDSSFMNDQFGEDDDDRSERQRFARIKARCPVCGRNPKLGQQHQADCIYEPRDPGE